MPELDETITEAWKSQRDLNAELEASIDDIRAGRVITYVVYKTDDGELAKAPAGDD